MDDSKFLIVSFFGAVLVSLCLGLIAYLRLRRPFEQTTSAVRPSSLRAILKRLFPASLLLFALSSSLSVSYYGGCNPKTYQQIVSNRSYIEAKSREQVSTSIYVVVLALAAWLIILLVMLAIRGRNPSRSNLE